MRPPSAPATDDQIGEWTSTVRTTGLGFRLNGAPSDSTAWPLILHELMQALDPPSQSAGDELPGGIFGARA
jgi:hypothetical protein